MRDESKIEAVRALFASYHPPDKDSYSIGRQAIELLLRDCAASELGPVEASLLLRAYNWAGRHEEVLTYAVFAVRRWGDGFLPSVDLGLSSAYVRRDEFLEKADAMIVAGIGEPAFWHQRKADHHYLRATVGEEEAPEWQPGDPIYDMDALHRAAQELRLALAADKSSRHPCNRDWPDRYRAVLEQPEYRWLRPALADELCFYVREERPMDVAAIRTLTETAFRDAPHGDHTEHLIVDALRNARALTMSLVAVERAIVVGHVAASPVSISDGTTGWFGIGPVSVHPDRQRKGIGTALVKVVVRSLRDRGESGCVVVGDSAYYGRFGFRREPTLTFPDLPPEYFQVIAFGRVPSGVVTYHTAFSTA